MKLLLVRHAKAEDREGFDGPDDERPLTANGRQKFRAAAKGLRKLAPDISLLATSPLLRARQTAEVLARVFAAPGIVEQDLLAPGGSRKALLGWLAEQADDDVIALVGHEPDLSELATCLLAKSAHPLLEFRKGAAALVRFEGRPAAGHGVLEWLLPPAVLRRLA